MRIHYLQHAPFEGIGAIAEWAATRGHQVSGTPMFAREFLHPGEFEMLVVMGGPMSIHQEREFPWLAEEKRFIRAAIDQGKLVLGICLGAQLVADVLGGQVLKGAQLEIGWYPVDLTQNARASVVFGGLPDRFDTLHWHGDTFTIPPGAKLIASSAVTPNQAFESHGGRVVGLQFHMEATPASWAALSRGSAGELLGAGEWISSAEEMLSKRALFEPNNRMLFSILDAMEMRTLGV